MLLVLPAFADPLPTDGFVYPGRPGAEVREFDGPDAFRIVVEAVLDRRHAVAVDELRFARASR